MDETGFLPERNALLLCVPCRRAGRCRIGITEVRQEEDGSLAFDIACPSEYEAAPGLAHGGWTANVFDEMLGHVALRVANGFVVTRRLGVEYLRPVPVGRALIGTSRVESMDGGDLAVTGELRLAGGVSLVGRATATMTRRDASHFAKTQEWLSREGSGGAD